MTAVDTKARPRIAVVADDLTGAADAAAPFASRGAEVSLMLSGPPRDGVDVLALVSDSRWRAASDAANRVGQLVRQARAWGADTLFVKVDSTLRGNVRAEVGAALAAWGGVQAVAAPAFPAQGRVVRRGVLVVHGQMQHGSVADCFPDDVRLFDAGTDEELDDIAERILAERSVAVGSAGLARALADAILPGPHGVLLPGGPVAGVLVVVGTAHPVSRMQALALTEAGTVRVLVTPSAPVSIEEAVLTLARGGRVLVTTDTVETDTLGATAMAAELAIAVQAISVAVPTAALVLTGGATALAVARALGARELRLLAEITPGVVIGELVLGDRRIPVITKSGGFGACDALLQAATTLEACA